MRTNEINLTVGRKKENNTATLPFLRKRLHELEKHEENQPLVDRSFRAMRNLSLKSPKSNRSWRTVEDTGTIEGTRKKRSSVLISLHWVRGNCVHKLAKNTLIQKGPQERHGS